MYPSRRIKFPKRDLVIYTVVNTDKKSAMVIDEVRDIVGDADYQFDIDLPAYFCITRYSVEGSPVTYIFCISAKVPAFSKRVHISEVDNETFVDHLFLIASQNLLKV